MHPTPDLPCVGRARALFVLALLAFVATSGWLVFGHRLSELAGLGIPTMQPRFADARTISGASVSLAQGHDPLASNPGDPWGRPMNYPRVWLVFANLGVGPEDTTKLALAFFAAFVAGLALLVPLARSPAIALVLTACLFSPAAWLAVERANNDLLLFGLLAAAAWLVAKRLRLASLCVGTAAVLKLFPIFALAGLCTNGARRALRSALPVLLLFLGYAWWIRADLKLIQANTVHWNRIAYGIDQLPNAISAQTGWPFLPLLAATIACLLLALAVSAVARSRARLGGAASPHALAAFRIGAGVYLGTFCIGSNFDYRLVFLLLAVPQLTTWAATTRGRVRAGAVLMIGVLVLMLWGMTWRLWLAGRVGSEGPGLMIDEGLSWALAFGMLGALVLSLPDWMLPASRRGALFLDAGVAGAGAAVLPMPLPTEEVPPREQRGVGNTGVSG